MSLSEFWRQKLSSRYIIGQKPEPEIGAIFLELIYGASDTCILVFRDLCLDGQQFKLLSCCSLTTVYSCSHTCASDHAEPYNLALAADSFVYLDREF